jgi:excisionase family DNA binding protein
MAGTKIKPTSRSRRESPAPNANGTTCDVMTLAEAATYLRLPETEVMRLVREQELPGRAAGAEWRFLKSALQAWLSKPAPTPSKQAQLAVAGAWKDDPYVEEELREIYKRRGRPMTEGEA